MTIAENEQQEIAEFTATVLADAEATPANIVLPGLLSAFLTAAIWSDQVAGAPKALRSMADALERDMEKLLSAMAMHDAQSATMQ